MLINFHGGGSATKPEQTDSLLPPQKIQQRGEVLPKLNRVHFGVNEDGSTGRSCGRCLGAPQSPHCPEILSRASTGFSVEKAEAVGRLCPIPSARSVILLVGSTSFLFHLHPSLLLCRGAGTRLLRAVTSLGLLALHQAAMGQSWSRPCGKGGLCCWVPGGKGARNTGLPLGDAPQHHEKVAAGSRKYLLVFPFFFFSKVSSL